MGKTFQVKNKYNTLDNVQESFSDVLWREINMLASYVEVKVRVS